MSDFVNKYIDESIQILNAIDKKSIKEVADGLINVRDSGGRLFILGVGGSSATASHAVNDFRKICAFESYAATDNVSELTARTNDEGWSSVFSNWLKGSRLKNNDGVLVLSVGGGSKEKNISVNIVEALDHAVNVGAKIFGIIGKDGGYTKTVANACVVIPPLVDGRITPNTEGLASVIAHLIVSYPGMQVEQTKWDSIK